MEDAANNPRRRTYTFLTGLILLTLPCYCAGFIALALAPTPGTTPSPTNTLLATYTGLPPQTVTGTVTLETLTPTLTLTASPSTPTGTFQATPTQFVPPSRTPSNT